jgi:hypothetical protein
VPETTLSHLLALHYHLATQTHAHTHVRTRAHEHERAHPHTLKDRRDPSGGHFQVSQVREGGCERVHPRYSTEKNVRAGWAVVLRVRSNSTRAPHQGSEPHAQKWVASAWQSLLVRRGATQRDNTAQHNATRQGAILSVAARTSLRMSGWSRHAQ